MQHVYQNADRQNLRLSKCHCQILRILGSACPGKSDQGNQRKSQVFSTTTTDYSTLILPVAGPSWRIPVIQALSSTKFPSVVNTVISALITCSQAYLGPSLHYVPLIRNHRMGPDQVLFTQPNHHNQCSVFLPLESATPSHPLLMSLPEVTIFIS